MKKTIIAVLIGLASSLSLVSCAEDEIAPKNVNDYPGGGSDIVVTRP